MNKRIILSAFLTFTMQACFAGEILIEDNNAIAKYNLLEADIVKLHASIEFSKQKIETLLNKAKTIKKARLVEENANSEINENDLCKILGDTMGEYIDVFTDTDKKESIIVFSDFFTDLLDEDEAIALKFYMIKYLFDLDGLKRNIIRWEEFSTKLTIFGRQLKK